jgi:Met-zincin
MQMSNDMVTYAEDRFKLVNNLIPRLKDKYSKPGKSWHELRVRYGNLNGQRAGMVNAVTRFIGGVQVERGFPGQEGTTKPLTPVTAAYQKKAMDLLSKYLFAPNAFDTDAQLFPYLQLQRRGFNFYGNNEDIKPENIVMGLQAQALAHLFSAATQMRITNSTTYGNTYTVADVMNDLTRAAFTADLKGTVNVYRQNLQTEIIKGLSNIIGTSPMYDNVSKAAALSTLKKIKVMLAGAVSPDEQTRAHRTNLNFLIDKATVIK